MKSYERAIARKIIKDPIMTSIMYTIRYRGQTHDIILKDCKERGLLPDVDPPRSKTALTHRLNTLIDAGVVFDYGNYTRKDVPTGLYRILDILTNDGEDFV